jgi:hypothetical protein
MVTLGYSYRFNALKFRILDTLYKAKKPMTVRDIGYETGIHYTRISSAMSRYQKIHKKNGKIIKTPYIRRLEQKGPNNSYRYIITKSGRKAYFDYLNRVKDGKSLNRIQNPNKNVNENIVSEFEVQQADLIPYVTINKKGRKQGVYTTEDIFCMENNLKHHNLMSEWKRKKFEAAKTSAPKTPEAKIS